MFDDLGQLPLVLGRVETAVERGTFDPAFETLLQGSHFVDQHVGVGVGAFQNFVMTHETGGILDDQHQSAELVLLAGLAAAVQLRVRFEQAEELVAVGNRFALQHAAVRARIRSVCLSSRR